LPIPQLKQIQTFKYACWFDLFSKNFIEKLAPIPGEWNGYVPWDMYSSNICNISKQNGVNVSQYILENQVIWFTDSGCWTDKNGCDGDGKMKTLYYNLLAVKTIGREQRKEIDNNIIFYLEKWYNYAKNSNIIK
jgi:hypothetical protein